MVAGKPANQQLMPGRSNACTITPMSSTSDGTSYVKPPKVRTYDAAARYEHLYEGGKIRPNAVRPVFELNIINSRILYPEPLCLHTSSNFDGLVEHLADAWELRPDQVCNHSPEAKRKGLAPLERFAATCSAISRRLYHVQKKVAHMW